MSKIVEVMFYVIGLWSESLILPVICYRAIENDHHKFRGFSPLPGRDPRALGLAGGLHGSGHQALVDAGPAPVGRLSRYVKNCC